MSDLQPVDLKFLINSKEFQDELERVRKGLRTTTDEARTEAGKMKQIWADMARVAAGAFSITAAQNFVREMVNVRGQFQQIEVAYTTMLRSKTAADALMAQSIDLAARTPFGLMDVANSTKQLIAYGFEAKNVTGTLEMLGNVAAGVGSNIGDIAYLYGTLRTQGRAYQQDINQFTNRGIPIIAELAKQFGVAESEVRKLVEQGKVGFPAVEKAFKSLTSESGIFYNLMREQSKTLTGQIANLGDAWDVMLNNLGATNEGIISGSISALTTLVENYEEVIRVVKALIVVYGAYKAATIVTSIIQQTQALGSLTQALKAATGAQVLFNAASKANPVGLIVAGITAAVSAWYLYKSHADQATTATGAISKEMNKAVFSANSLFDALRKARTGTREHAEAIRLVNERYGKYLDNLLTNKSTLNDIEAAQKRVTRALMADIAVKSSQAKIEETLSDYTERLESAFEKYAEAFSEAKGADRLHEFWSGLNDAMERTLAGAGNATQNAIRFGNEYLRDIGTLRYDLYDGTFNSLFRGVFERRLSARDTVNQLQAFAKGFSKDFNNLIKDDPETVTTPGTTTEKDTKAEAERQKKITADLKKELDERMSYFERYEEYKTAVNESEAMKRYGNELQGFATYDQYLQSQLDDVYRRMPHIGYACISPYSIASLMADARFLTSNFSIRFLRWLSTVCGLINSTAAISCVVSPLAAWWRISFSRRVTLGTLFSPSVVFRFMISADCEHRKRRPLMTVRMPSTISSPTAFF